MASILVAYATRHGSTQEVAEAIGARLSEQGALVEVQPVGEIHSVEGFDAFVLGAPIYSGRWDHHASRFLKRHRRMLETLPVAIFALGPRDTSEEAFTRSRGQLDRSLGQVGWLRPNCVELFGGVDPPKRNRPDRRDARDWAAIRAWADALPDALHRGSVGHVDSG